MFEKSLYDLIRGMRNHKGNEKEYIQNCLKECRSEIRSSDIDLKATALLKLIYLEMVGHDMSWASFHVLEVMSSSKYHQKRVGYLGAVQTFRHDTEVLMLATNLLKKDLSSASTTVISLPIAALPHVINPSLALSVLSDLLPRLNHSNAAIRKKTIVTLYRLALVYPETLRAAWPKIKERLMDKGEDSSVTAAIVNVICELGWRRPRDFLPLAPRLFELLVEGGNNWMAIKLIKLFATLTPLEPRLKRKLLPPLTELIRTTPAMSLLYECIHGLIQGGILGQVDDPSGRDEIASLCVSKLRGMIMVDGDPNLTYVALLAFNKIVVAHPFLVSQQEDVILGCIDSPDITIRIKALDLAQGMVTADNLVLIVGQLMKQLKPTGAGRRQPLAGSQGSSGTESDDEMPTPRTTQGRGSGTGRGGANGATVALPENYRTDVIRRILRMCSQNDYANISDFDWYIDVLASLVRMAPVPAANDDEPMTAGRDMSEKIGDELRNVAVRVKAMRGAAVRAGSLIIDKVSSDTPPGHPITTTALGSVVWLVGEYAAQVAHPQDVLTSVLQIIPRTSSPAILASCLQAAPKLFAVISRDEQRPWTAERKSLISLMLARMVHTIEPLTASPSLDIQERAVEFTELLKLTAEAVSGQPASTEAEHQDPPLLITQALPSLFAGWELNSVAPGAQKNVPVPSDLDLDQPIHPDLNRLLTEAAGLGLADTEGEEPDEFDIYYTQRPPPTSVSSEPAIDRLGVAGGVGEEYASSSSYQQADEDSYLDADVVARRRAERMERNKDDPFYIPRDDGVHRGQVSTPIHNILQSANESELDIDKIPIMKLDLGGLGGAAAQPPARMAASRAPRQKVMVALDETLDGTGRNSESESHAGLETGRRRAKQSVLQVDSSSLRTLSLEGGGEHVAGSYDYERQQREEAEMAKAIREVERLRLEMQRANERIQVAQGVDVEGAVVVKKKKKKQASAQQQQIRKPKDGPKKKGSGREAGVDEAGGAGGADEAGPAAGADDDDYGVRAAGGAGDAAMVVAKPAKKKKKKKKAGEGPAEILDLV